MPTSPKARRVLLASIPPNAQTIYELGSGWGHLAFPLAQTFPDAIIKAFELSPIPYLVAKGVQKIVSYPNLTLRRGDFMATSLADADVVVCYLFPGAMERLREKFERELKEGATIVTNSFSIPGWQAERVVEIDDLWRTKIYTYTRKRTPGSQ